MNTTEYKTFHESFMQNNQGSTALHTFFCVLFTLQCSIYSAIGNQSSGGLQYVYEYIVIVLPLIVAHTILADYIYVLNLVIFSVLLYRFVSNYSKFNFTRTFSANNIYHTKHVLSITIIRGLTYLITIFCILAVDFQSFPRYLAKTESVGYSLMDTGVGLFVLISGLVHKDVKKHKVSDIIKSNTKFISVLVFLGIARFISIKQLDYQEHVTEYGVHWNFFFTLAICKLLSTLLLLLINQALLLSFCTTFLHQILLDFYLEDWVFSSIPRTDLYTANREGISSTLGYVSLYLFAVHLKEILTNKGVPRYFVIAILIMQSIFLWLLLCLVNSYSLTSRTLANAGYCIYIEAVLVTVLTIMYFIEVLFQYENSKLYCNIPLILSAVNDNGLLYFLVANLLTGAINLSVKTLFVPARTTFIILNSYMIVTIALVVYFKNKGVRI